MCVTQVVGNGRLCARCVVVLLKALLVSYAMVCKDGFGAIRFCLMRVLLRKPIADLAFAAVESCLSGVAACVLSRQWRIVLSRGSRRWA